MNAPPAASVLAPSIVPPGAGFLVPQALLGSGGSWLSNAAPSPPVLDLPSLVAPPTDHVPQPPSAVPIGPSDPPVSAAEPWAVTLLVVGLAALCFCRRSAAGR